MFYRLKRIFTHAMPMFILKCVLQLLIFCMVGARAAEENKRVLGFFDLREKKIWFVNDSDQDLFLGFPGSSFAIKGILQNNEVDIKSIQAREAWFLTSPKNYKPTKEDAITITDLEDIAKIDSFTLWVRARHYSNSGKNIILGNSFNLKIAVKIGKYKNLTTSTMLLNEIKLKHP
jgi:hypothetical protein